VGEREGGERLGERAHHELEARSLAELVAERVSGAVRADAERNPAAFELRQLGVEIFRNARLSLAHLHALDRRGHFDRTGAARLFGLCRAGWSGSAGLGGFWFLSCQAEHEVDRRQALARPAA